MSMPIGRTLDNPGEPLIWDRPADQVRNGINRQVQRIRDQRGITPEASQALMAAAYLKGKATLDGMSTALGSPRAAHRRRHPRHLHPLPRRRLVRRPLTVASPSR